MLASLFWVVIIFVICCDSLVINLFHLKQHLFFLWQIYQHYIGSQQQKDPRLLNFNFDISSTDINFDIPKRTSFPQRTSITARHSLLYLHFNIRLNLCVCDTVLTFVWRLLSSFYYSVLTFYRQIKALSFDYLFSFTQFCITSSRVTNLTAINFQC